MATRVVAARVHDAAVEAPALVWRQVRGERDTGSPANAWMGPPGLPAAPHSPFLKDTAADGASREPSHELEGALAEAQIRAQAAQVQAHRDGLTQGRLEGEQRAMAELAPLLERFARTIADLSGTRDAFRREAEEDVVRLALGVARRILHRELSIDPDALTGVIHVALGKFESRELHRVLVSPEDQPAIAAALQSLKLPKRVEVIGDPTLERGAALFETVKGTLDASVETQLDEIERGFLDVLGKDGRRG